MASWKSRLLFLTVCSLYWKQFAAESTCSVILVEHTAYNHGSSGLYEETNTVCNDSLPVYQLVNGKAYVYYYSSGSVGGWAVGSVACNDEAVLFVSTDVFHPADVTETWGEVNNETGSPFWEDNNRLEVSCSSLVYGGCSEVELGGTNHKDQLEGTYSVLSSQSICDGKFSYRRTSDQYLYNYNGYWVVGPVRCDDAHHMIVHDSAFYPYDITEDWHEYTSSLGYTSNSFAAVGCVQETTTPDSCTGLKAGAIEMMILIAVLAIFSFP